MNSKKRALNTVIVSGGGTGGHYYPALAIMEALRKRASELPASMHIDFHYVGSSYGIESRLAAKNDVPYTLIPLRGFSRYLTLKFQARNLLLPFRLLVSFIRIAVLYRRLRPIATIASGGYASAIPGKISNLFRIPLFVQEQNAFPGVTTRLLAKKAAGFFCAYDSVREYIPARVPFYQVGNPVRSAIRQIPLKEAHSKMNLKADKFTVFVFAGSQGSASINRYLAKHIESWINEYKFQMLWQTGETSYEELKTLFGANPDIQLMKYIEDMSAAYSASDMVIARAGALSLAEIEKMRLPAILIPLPGAAGNHQYHNAKSFESRGCAYLIEEKDFPNNPFIPILDSMIKSPGQLEKMRAAFPQHDSNAADTIARNILEHLQSLYSRS